MSLGTPNDVNAISGTSATDMLAVGEEGMLLRYDGHIWRSEIGGFFVEMVSE